MSFGILFRVSFFIAALMPPASLKIRTADRADVPDLFALIQALADYEKLTDAVVGSVDALKDHLFGTAPCIEAIVAEDNGKTIGFALFFTRYSTFLMKPGIYLEDLFVLPEYRGQGVGKALLSRLAQLVIKRQWGRLEWAVLDWNEPAIAFYRRMGASIADDIRIGRLTGEALTQLNSTQFVEGLSALRPAVQTDISSLYALAQANADFHHCLHELVGSLEAFETHLFGTHAYAKAVVAEQAGQIVAFALFFTNYSTFLTKPGLHIEDLFVTPESQWQGLGQALLTEVARQAAVQNYGRVEWFVMTWNKSAIALYHQIGATVLEDWRVCRLAGTALVNLAQSTSVSL
jgi:GNAT superfamily N-acetyltransferase